MTSESPRHRSSPLLFIGLVTLVVGGFVLLLPAPTPAPTPAAGPPMCGNNVREGGEQCDGSDLDGLSCADYSCSSGTLTCSASCTLETTSCGDCGGSSGNNPAGTAEILFTTRTDDYSASNISYQEQRLLDLLDNETVAIRAALDGLGRINVVDRLLAAHNRGVLVQVVADCEIVVVGADPEYQLLINAGIAVVDDNNEFNSPTTQCTSNTTSGFMHNKFMIFEGQQTVWTGSTNMTDSAFNSAHNAIAILSGNPDIVAFYAAEFGEMFGNGLSLRDGGTGRFGRQKTLNPGIGSFALADGSVVEVAFSPYNQQTTSDTQAQLEATVDSAQDELLWGAYFLTYTPFSDRVVASTATIKRGTIDPRSTDQYSNVQSMINSGEEILVTNILGAHHAKFAIADADAIDGQVLLASHNFTSSGFNYNNENSVRILSPALAQTARAGFDSVWNDPQNAGIVSCVHAGESYNENSNAVHRCNNGWDDNYDGVGDSADPNCAAPFTCDGGGGGTCKMSGDACSGGAECCSGTCLHGKTQTCS